MKTRRWALVVLGTAVACGWGTATARAGAAEPPPDGKPILGGEQSVLAAHDKRIALTIAGDLTGLAAMMTDDLTYTHSSGVEESKAQFLEGLKNGKYVYREITPRDRKVRVHGDAAIVSGPAHIVIEPGGKRTELELYFTELYVKEAGQWRMALWQSTRLPAPATAVPATK
jgi:ketosteroid isomerase-like protein